MQTGMMIGGGGAAVLRRITGLSLNLGAQRSNDICPVPSRLLMTCPNILLVFTIFGHHRCLNG